MKKVIADFNKKLIIPLFEDIRRTLEVTCHNSGNDNHGSNFIGNSIVLLGIETIAQFTDSSTEEDYKSFKKEANECYKSIEEEKQKYCIPKHSPSNGSDLAKSFMKEYFNKNIFQKKEFGVPLYEVVWAFRNEHMHSFYPYYKKTFNENSISGSVSWLYLDSNNRIGITIKELEDNFEQHKSKLYLIKDNNFCICPQILFVFFKQAVDEFIKKVDNSDDIYKKFHQNYKRLAQYYNFKA